jgi:protein-S-isoprenylcysteine O-methyltransferase Ste14
MNNIFVIIWISWFLSEILLNRFFRSKRKNAGNPDKHSLGWIWITIGVGNTLGILSAIYLRFPISGTNMVSYGGLLFIVAGMAIRFLAIRTLGKFFTVDLSIRGKHKLVDTGLYKTIRHPSYTGSLISFLGFGFSLNNWISLVVIFLPVLTAMLYRISIEEKLLLAQPDLGYETYIKKTKRLIPGIY